MGIPKFTKWISERYPNIIQHIDKSSIIPEYDNLYIDCNSIIHACAYEKGPIFKIKLPEEEIYSKISNYIKNIVNYIKPKKLLFIALDGVSPRAKMNNQRSHRFSSLKTLEESIIIEKSLGNPIPHSDDLFDSSCISPGTIFMDNINRYLNSFIKDQVNGEWKHLNVIYSGSNVIGEGEHKIISFIRKMKSQDTTFTNTEEYHDSFKQFTKNIQNSMEVDKYLWNPNTSHCIYGLDADLIILSLITHEPHFSLLRENLFVEYECFHLIHISLLREYIHTEFKHILDDCDTLKYDLERIIDDFVFLTFFIGNDFLPTLPFLDLYNDKFNSILEIYKDNLKYFGDYITNLGNINPIPCQKLLTLYSVIENNTLNTIMESNNENDSSTTEIQNNENSTNDSDNQNIGNSDNKQVNITPLDILEKRLKSLNISTDIIENQKIELSNVNPGDILKQGYYLPKFKKSITDIEFQETLHFNYMQGLVWTLRYYYCNCPSWEWNYPYSYAPLASDLAKFTQYDKLLSFPASTPFTPFELLVCVIAKSSVNLLPKPYQALIIDENSPLKDYYSLDFEIDLNGKKNSWEGVVLIPFIDCTLLRKLCASIDDNLLSDKEKSRNTIQHNHIYYYNDNNTIVKDTLILPTIENPCTLNSNALMGIDILPQYPTLATLSHESKLILEKKTLFTGDIRNKEVLILKLKTKPLWNTSASQSEIIDICKQLGKELLGSTVYCNWPYRTEAIVGQIWCKHAVINKKEIFPLNDSNNWSEITTNIKNDFVKLKGIDIENIQILIGLYPMLGTTTQQNGKVKKIYNETVFWHPYQSIIRTVNKIDKRYQEKEELPFIEVYALKKPVIITQKLVYGSVGEIIDINEADSSVQISYTSMPKLQNFPKKNFYLLDNTNFSTFDTIASKLNVSKICISRILGRVKVDNIDIGLMLYSPNNYVIGYSKHDKNVWYFTDKVLNILTEYYKLYPEVFSCISLSGNNTTITQYYSPSMIFPDNTEQRFIELKNWIGSLHLDSFEHNSIHEVSMSSKALKKTEIDFKKFNQTFNNSSKQVNWYNINYIQVPLSKNMEKDNFTLFNIGDYVSFLSKGTLFGSIAIIVSINKYDKTLGLLFAKEIIEGTTKNGNLSEASYLPNVRYSQCLKLFSPTYIHIS